MIIYDTNIKSAKVPGWIWTRYINHIDGKEIPGKEAFPMDFWLSIPQYQLTVWDGQSTWRNGRRRFLFVRTIRTHAKPKEVKQIYADKYPKGAVIKMIRI